MFTSSIFTPGQTYPVSQGGGWVSGLFGGNQAGCGVMVTPKTAMQFIAVQACVTLLAESVAQLPCQLYRRTRNGGREIAMDHPLYDVIHLAPNAWMTAIEYREQAQVALGLRGNSYSLIKRNPAGQVEELIPLHDDKIQVLRGADCLPYYKLLDSNETVPMRFIHHIRWHSENNYTGMSPIQLHRDPIGLGMAVEKHAEKVFSSGTTLSGVIERPLEAKDLGQDGVNRIKQSWKDEHGGGLKNLLSVALLQEGMKFNKMSMTNEDAQLLASRQYSVNEIARIWKIPPHMVQHLEKATFSNIEQQGLQYLSYTLVPWLKRHEQAMMRDLLTKKERQKYYIEFNVSGLLRGDQKARYEAYAIARNWGWLSVNEIRRLENMPPTDGGDTYLQPLNMVDAKSIRGINATEDVKAHLEQIEANLL